MDKIPNWETKEPHSALRGASQPPQLIPQMQRPLGRLCGENKTVLDPSKTVSGGAHIFLHAHRVWVSRRVSDPPLPTGARKGSNPEGISVTHRALDQCLSHCSPSPSGAAAQRSHLCLVGRAVGASDADRDILKGACTSHTVSATCSLSICSHLNGREGFFPFILPFSSSCFLSSLVLPHLSELSFPVAPFSLFPAPSHSTDCSYILFQVSSVHVSSLLLCYEEVGAEERAVENIPLLQQKEA